MTPAKLILLLGKRMDYLALLELPVTQIACMFYNANRSPGDKERGIPPAPMKHPNEFRSFRRKRSLAAKDEFSGPGGRHVLGGAIADRNAWESLARGNGGNRIIVVRD